MGCEHRGCECEETSVERGGKRFCGETCAEMETTGRHLANCPCGHPPCAVA
jgi:hypothetical protein